MIHLVIGGARSGKSTFAEKQAMLVAASDRNPELKIVYIATASIKDDEMAQRIQHHQQSRPKDWLLIEEPLALSNVISTHSHPNKTLIIECMTLWLTNWLCSTNYEQWPLEKQAFIDALMTSQSNIIIVSNEVGSGIVPLGKLSRDFVDQAGWLNQDLVEIADKVTLVVAGCAIALKENSG
ncbi:MAG: bifunctional adenosylcobinamide kinase/adenosylcobinamide-phosphate guanylyltransferase [gamma proteobacterium symbiont of Taylorina sp.]|nr:bifunctional adenosylcobinamide kinase/adenosylcobinamide-phosphate guanylyltransferase [gamma proteobacterium symbiont of Taylorina sp.]